jgi:2-succinyl-5-enolpyruvyl-6-hydroxy-3-cyclohexene-1-carboxylate synthase
MEAGSFLEQLALKIGFTEEDEDYLKSWQKLDYETGIRHHSFFSDKDFGEFEAMQEVMRMLPENSQLHLANSMSVRYANYIGLRNQPNVTVFCNRGTSGIDGSNSTAVGAAMAQGQMITLVTGDMAFFYDRNAFWHKYKLPNLRIILLNNHAGGIFRLIKGPSDQPELEEYFETDQTLKAGNTAKDFKMDYFHVADFEELQDQLQNFYQPSEHAKLLEITTDSATNAGIFKTYKGQ